MSVLPLDRRYSPCDGITFRRTLPGGILLNLTTGAYFELNDAGVAIWVRLAAGDSVGEIVSVLRLKYDVAGDVAERDVNHLCDAVLGAGLVNARKAAP